MAKHGARLMFAINKIKELESFVKLRLEFLWKVVLEATFSKWDGVILRTFPPVRNPSAHVITRSLSKLHLPSSKQFCIPTLSPELRFSPLSDPLQHTSTRSQIQSDNPCMSAHGPLTLHSAQTHPASLVAPLSVSCAVKGATKSLLILD